MKQYQSSAQWLWIPILFVLFCRCGASQHAASVNEIRIVPRSGWNAAEPRLYKSHVPVRITVHHEGTRMEATDDAAKKIKAIQAWGMGPDRQWADIPYHFLIAPDGTIYEGRNVQTAGETGTEYDPSGHLLISCLGNLEVQEVRQEQLRALVKLIAYTSQKYRLPLETLSAHRDHSTKTTCPGKNLYHYIQNGYLQKEAKKYLVTKQKGEE